MTPNNDLPPSTPAEAQQGHSAGCAPTSGSPSSDAPETDSTFRVLEAAFVAWAKGELYTEDVQAMLIRAKASVGKLERERDKLKLAVVEFMEIADDVADSRHGHLRFLRLADELDERLDGILPENA